MIPAIVRTALISLKRDRGALALSFVLPIVFFTIFAVIFGGRRDTVPKITVVVVDQDHSMASRRLVTGLQEEGSLRVLTRPAPKRGVEQPEYTAATAEAAVRAGDAPAALIIPPSFGKNTFAPGAAGERVPVQLLKDPSDMVASQVIAGLLQKVAMTSMPDMMAEQGTQMLDQYSGGLTPEQRQRIEASIDSLRRAQERQAAAPSPNPGASGNDTAMIVVQSCDVVGENKNNSIISFYAAAIGVMFLLFTSSGAAGAILDEAESGTLDRVLSSRVSMTTLLAGKLTYNALLAFVQLVVMFVWAWVVFKLDFLPHLAGFAIMGLSTAFAVAAFGLLLASICKTRAQLGALSTLVILIMSSVGGSMFPRFLMPEAMQKAGLLTINAWAIDGFTKVFWRDEPLTHLAPQVAVLLGVGVALFFLARRLARRWEYA